ncbi:MAG: LCP family protein [Clostridia bacterium]|nr:LCP family protein [Clostridia bacterium]
MSYDKRRGRRTLSFRSLYMVALYAVILLAIIAAGLLWERGRQPEKAAFGSLDGRFDSGISLAYGDRIVRYREYEITNYLFIGMDRDEITSSGYQNGGQADFLMLLSIDRANRTITPVMIDRDTMTPVTTYGVFGNAAGTRMMQICLAHAFSGADVSGSENTAEAVSGLLGGVKIDRCLLTDLNGIVLLNDAIGGVTVTLEDDLTALDPALQKGATVKLTGDLAEHFVRGRMTVADGTNASRMRRQKAYIEAMLDQLKEQMDGEGTILKKVFESLSGHVKTSVGQNVLIAEADAYSTYEWKELRTLPGTHGVGGDGFTEYWTDEEALMEMIVEIWFE